jgi:hypothetical protein
MSDADPFDFDPRRIEWEYPLWVIALDRAGGPVPDKISPDDPAVNYERGSAGQTGECVTVFTDQPAAEDYVAGMKRVGAKLVGVANAFEFLAFLRALAARGYGGVVFDPLPTTKRVFPASLPELIDDIERRIKG